MHSRTLPTHSALAAALIAIHILALSPLDAADGPDSDEAIRHVLNRIAFGPRPSDIERMKETGLKRYIEQQLHPERVQDDQVEAELSAFRTVTLSSAEIANEYERPLLEMRRARQQQGASSTPEEMRRTMQQPGNEVVVELAQQKLLRAVYSERQLHEVLADFWFNHFNVDARKGRTRFLLTEYEREAIRPHVLGRFRDLLEATAKSPAMLFYLDNWMSVDANGPRLAAMGRGLNENYARELMELHTLGVDGGFTQKDVTEVARAFTGWTIPPRRQGGASFRFVAALHDDGQKVVLGRTIKAGGGMTDGEQVLDLLASHPSTARFISLKLARRFVSDSPPRKLVDRMAERFRATGGDLREVMRALFMSPEFLSPDAYRTKVKTPLEFVVSAARATGAVIGDARPLVRAMQQLGMPLYQCQPPTGYKDTADAWTSTGALVSRMNFAAMLTSEPRFVIRLPDRNSFLRSALGPHVSEATGATIAKASSDPQVAALTLGSPEFQKR
jgi:uncharacterized protein (DUF1800 family)